jgi:LAO/AO transport system kinase
VEAELGALIAISNRADQWKPAVVKTVASEGKGTEDCAQAIDAWFAHLRGSGSQREKAVQNQKERLLDLVHSEVRRSLLQDRAAAARLEELALMLTERRTDPYSAADELLRGWKFTPPPTEE